MNHYQTLGVSKDATSEEIKKAYRRLASKHHPDKGGDPTQFREVQEAYDVIGDPSAREQYDNPQSAFSRAFEDPGGGGGIFEEMFARRGGFEFRAPRNPDATVNITITLAQAYTGADLTVDTGFSKENIYIAPGVRDDSRIRISQKGYSRFKELPPGDLLIRISIEYPSNIVRDKDDIHQVIEISAFDAMLGSEVVTTHFSGKQLKVKIPAGSQPGSKLRLSKWGMMNPSTKITGNLFLILSITMPNISKPEHVELLNKIKSEVSS